MPLPTAYTSGTATITNGSDQVVGQDTVWTDLLPGDLLWSPVDGVSVRVLSIEDNTHLTLAFVWPGTTTSADPYEIRITPDSARMQEQTRQLLEQLSALDANSQGLFYTLVAGTSDSDPGEGGLKFNDATLADATALYIDDYDANTPNRLVTGLMGIWTAGTSIIIRSLETTAYVSYQLSGPVTAATGYRKATGITYLGGSGTLTTGEPVSVGWFGVGEGIEIDAQGSFAGRDTYDDEPAGFTYLSTDGDGSTGIATLYRKNSATTADWSVGAEIQGETGSRGWSPRHGIASDGERRVLQLLGYVGGEGTAPTTGVNQYISAAGYTSTIGDAIDIRGASGATGASAYALALSEGFVGTLTDWLASLNGEDGDSAYQVAVADGFVGDVSAWLASLNGTDGADGTDPGILMIWSTSTTDANPGDGVLRADNADLPTAQTLYVSKINRAGDDIEAFLVDLDASSNPTNKGTLVLTVAGGAAQAAYRVLSVEDASGYVKITVDQGVGAAAFVNSDLISFQFERAGDQGTSGAGTGDVLGPASAVDGNLAMFDGATGKLLEDSGFPTTDIMISTNDLSDVNNKNTALDNLHINGADIASAATVNLETATGAFVEVTGTTTTTAITLSSGHQRLVRAGGAWPLTHGTDLQLPGAASYTCAAGDLIHFVADGSVVRATIFPVSGQPAVRVSNAKLAQVATATIKGRTTASTGDLEDLTTTQARALLMTATAAKSANYTVVAADNGGTLAVDASGGSRTITLLAAATAGSGFRLTIQKSDSSANTVVVDANSSELIDGALTRSLRLQYQSMTLVCDGSAWHVVAEGQLRSMGQNGVGGAQTVPGSPSSQTVDATDTVYVSGVGGVSVTAFDNGELGQMITVRGSSGFTLVHSTGRLRLTGSVNWTPATSNDFIRVVCAAAGASSIFIQM